MKNATQQETTIMYLTAILATTGVDMEKALENAMYLYQTVLNKLQKPPLVTKEESVWDDDAWDDDEEEEQTNTKTSIWGDENMRTEFEALPSQGTVIFPVYGPVDMKEISSSNISSMGHSRVVSADKGWVVSLFMRFKGGDYYRYDAIPLKLLEDLMAQAVNSYKGNPDASVGSNFHHLIKVGADEGTYKCWKFKDENWVEVLPKSERTKDTIKKRVQK